MANTPVTAAARPRVWRAVCRDVRYQGGHWPRSEFLQWDLEGPDAPHGRGAFFQTDALVAAAAPELLDAAKALVDRNCRYSGGDIIIPCGDHQSALRLLRAVRDAIDKAEGRS